MSTSIPSIPANGQAVKTHSMFRQACAVAINIEASADHIWSILTTANDFPRWNSTVESLKGTIAVGEKVELRVPYAPERTFKLKVDELVPSQKMVWSDGMAPMFRGVRTYQLIAKPDGTTDFSMVEVIAGLMLPMIRKSLPDFGPPFAQYAADLKAEAERDS